MEYKILEEQDLELMLDFTDDENTKYNIENLKKFIDNKNNYGFIAKLDNKIIGFAYGYNLLKPDGKKAFYLDVVDIIPNYQNQGYGTKLMSYIRDCTKKIDCHKMYLITNKSNTSACKFYEKSGAISEANDDIVYVYTIEGDK